MNDSKYYDIAGLGKVPRVTAILSVISKPALYNWYAAHGAAKAKLVMERLKTLSPAFHEIISAELGEQFFRDGTSLKEEAANYGSTAHHYIEKFLKTREIDKDKFNAEPEPVQNAFTSFLEWESRTKLKLIKSESLVYSRKQLYAGTCDAICETVDGITLLDWKTSKYIYPEYHLQAIAYKYAAEEMSGEKIDLATICRFGKDGAFQSYVIPPRDYADLYDTFIDAKRLWTWQNTYAKNINSIAA